MVIFSLYLAKIWQILKCCLILVEKDKFLSLVKALQMKKFYIFATSNGGLALWLERPDAIGKDNSLIAIEIKKGGLAQLARAFDWQSKGRRFDSVILHKGTFCKELPFFQFRYNLK